MSQKKIQSISQAQKILEQASQKSFENITQCIQTNSLKSLKGAFENMETNLETLVNGKAADMKAVKEKATHAILEARDKVLDQSKAAVKSVDSEAHKQPWLFVGIAALAASLLGFFLGRKSKS
jgi:ElaB/YqjD/DUF883 family membrane-anchored ribosome-binding protein